MKAARASHQPVGDQEEILESANDRLCRSRPVQAKPTVIMETISNMEYLKPTEIDRIRLTLLYLLQASPHPKSASTNLSRGKR